MEGCAARRNADGALERRGRDAVGPIELSDHRVVHLAHLVQQLGEDAEVLAWQRGGRRSKSAGHGGKANDALDDTKTMQ